MRKVFIYDATPCGRRKLDSKRLSNYFTKNEYIIVKNPKKADIIILNTCAYSDERTIFSIKKVEDFKKYDADLIVVGCLPGIEEERLKEIFSGNYISTKNLEKFDDFFPENKYKFSELGDEITFWRNINEKSLTNILPSSVYKFINKLLSSKLINGFLSTEFKILSMTNKEVAHIRISYGCPANCSYCVIKKAVGPLKSKSVEVCIGEFKDSIEKGYKKFFITADDIGSYGIDIGTTFIHLLDEIIKIDKNFTIGIESLRPLWIVKFSKDLERLVKTGKIEFIGCSVQSGSAKILKKMNRYSDTKKIKESILKIKKSYPEIVLITEIIVGFPTETSFDFEKTLDFFKEVKFDLGYIYRYSDRAGSLSEKIDGKISADEIDGRMNTIYKLLRGMGYKIRYERSKTVLIFSN